MRRYLMLFAATLGFATASLPDDALADDTPDEVSATDDAENCGVCEVLLDLAIAHPRRAGARAQDDWRRPAETLAFFRVRPGMTVVDLDSANGWYAPILAPYLGDGRYVGGLRNAEEGSADRVLMALGPPRGEDLAARLMAAHAMLKPAGLLCIERQGPGLPRADIVAAVEQQGFALRSAGTDRMALLFRKRA